MWDERYSEKDYVYGKKPNEFLVQKQSEIPAGRVLCLAEGEGRNAVFLAEQGYQVLAVDASSVGMKKAAALAEERSVSIQTRVADLADFDIEAGAWDGVVSIFCHLPPKVRQSLYKKVVRGLRPGGVLVLEAYRPEQLEFKTGGPVDASFTVTLADLHKELGELNFIHVQEIEREVIEGKYHTGTGAVVQLVAVKS